ncbi:MAG: extensin family protein [Pseudomonadota bacterium]
MIAGLRPLAPIIAALSLAGCGGVIPASDTPNSPNSRASAAHSHSEPYRSAPALAPETYTRQAQRPVIAAAPQNVAQRRSEATCISELGAGGARFSALPDSYGAPGCHRLGTVQLTSIKGDQGAFGISNLGPVQCDVANAFSNWARFGVDRAAQQILGTRLARIETMGSYACRNVAGTNKRSAHSRAEAIDVSGFVLTDGRRINLTEDWSGGTPAEREFLRVVKSSACKRFGTVLSPDYDSAHADHFHLEGSIRTSNRKLCR